MESYENQQKLANGSKTLWTAMKSTKACERKDRKLYVLRTICVGFCIDSIMRTWCETHFHLRHGSAWKSSGNFELDLDYWSPFLTYGILNNYRARRGTNHAQ